jgi:hypothetical protein
MLHWNLRLPLSEPTLEHRHDDADERILREINGCVDKDTEGSPRSISKERNGLLKTSRLRHCHAGSYEK